jgi:uncharacterized SAM-binding protein YcdF (DUF218 family)
MKIKNPFLLIFYTSILLLILYIIVFLVVYPWQPRQIGLFHKPVAADAVVVCEGERYTRINQALSLIEQGYAHRLIFPDLELPENERAITAWQQLHPGTLEVLKDTGPTSTYEEALKTREFVRKFNLKTLLLVTSSYHSYRAWWVFQKVLTGIKVYSVPVPFGADWYDPVKVRPGNTYDEVFREEQQKFAFYYFWYGWRIY